jgi:hypothetical protein
VAFFKNTIRSALFRNDVGTRLGRVAICFLAAESAFGTETHSAATPRKIIVTHI